MKKRVFLVLVVLVLLAPVGSDGRVLGDASQAEPSGGGESGEESDEPLIDFIPSEEVSADSAISFPVDI